ncbi:MAG: alpha/beta fold hydrolase [Granulosicoccus sp.]
MIIELNGSRVFVGQGGVGWQADRQTLVLQHGAGMDRTIWVLLARYFARHGFNVVVPDLPGHGASEGNALTSIEEQAAFLWTLLDCLNSEHGLPDTPIVLGGHSMGALVATAAAGLRPDAVQHLLLFGAGYPMGVGTALLDAAKANEQAAVDMIAIFGHSYRSQLGHNAVAGISVQNAAMALLERAKPGVLFTDLQACNNYSGVEEVAGALKGVKATVISGDSDRMTPYKFTQNLADMLSAEVIVVDDSGHMMMGEQPERTLQAAKQVLLSGR